MTVHSAEHPNYLEAATLERVSFWTSLPATGELSTPGKSLIRETDADIRQNRLESALDAALALNAVEPGYIPGFIRTAELLVATRRRDHARALLRTISQREELLGSTEFEVELSRIRIHLSPDVDVTAAFAYRLLDHSTGGQAVPYVPAAINQLMSEDRFSDGVALASTWVEREPSSPLALCYLVRAHLQSGNGTAALKTIRHFRDEFDADRVWPENLVVSALASIASSNIDPKWMAAGPVCQGLRSKQLDYTHVTELLEFLGPVVDSPHRALLFAGLLATNANEHVEAQGIFQTTPAETPVETYLRNVGIERAAAASDDTRARFTALEEIWESLADPRVAALAENGEIFDPPANRKYVGVAIAQLLQESEAYADALTFLENVIRTGNTDAEVLRLQAELMGQSGSRDDALATLDALATRQENERKYADAVETLDAMIRLVPGNIRLRAQVVDNCLKIGRLEQAIEQLVMQGRLLHKAGRLIDAEQPIHRAIEIATMTDEWDQVSKLHRLLISFAPDETRPRHSAVATCVQYGRTSEALDQLRQIVRIARKHDDMDEAIGASHQMLALDPNDPGTYHQLGELLVSIREYNQADRVYRRLATLVPDDHAVKAKRSAIAALTRARQNPGNQ